MAEYIEDPEEAQCLYCEHLVLGHDQAITCDSCGGWQHISCGNTGVSSRMYERMVEGIQDVSFICQGCSKATQVSDKDKAGKHCSPTAATGKNDVTHDVTSQESDIEMDTIDKQQFPQAAKRKHDATSQQLDTEKDIPKKHRFLGETKLLKDTTQASTDTGIPEKHLYANATKLIQESTSRLTKTGTPETQQFLRKRKHKERASTSQLTKMGPPEKQQAHDRSSPPTVLSSPEKQQFPQAIEHVKAPPVGAQIDMVIPERLRSSARNAGHAHVSTGPLTKTGTPDQQYSHRRDKQLHDSDIPPKKKHSPQKKSSPLLAKLLNESTKTLPPEKTISPRATSKNDSTNSPMKTHSPEKMSPSAINLAQQSTSPSPKRHTPEQRTHPQASKSVHNSSSSPAKTRSSAKTTSPHRAKNVHKSTSHLTKTGTPEKQQSLQKRTHKERASTSPLTRMGLPEKQQAHDRSSPPTVLSSPEKQQFPQAIEPVQAPNGTQIDMVITEKRRANQKDVHAHVSTGPPTKTGTPDQQHSHRRDKHSHDYEIPPKKNHSPQKKSSPLPAKLVNESTKMLPPEKTIFPRASFTDDSTNAPMKSHSSEKMSPSAINLAQDSTSPSPKRHTPEKRTPPRGSKYVHNSSSSPAKKRSLAKTRSPHAAKHVPDSTSMRMEMDALANQMSFLETETVLDQSGLGSVTDAAVGQVTPSAVLGEHHLATTQLEAIAKTTQVEEHVYDPNISSAQQMPGVSGMWSPTSEGSDSDILNRPKLDTSPETLQNIKAKDDMLAAEILQSDRKPIVKLERLSTEEKVHETGTRRENANAVVLDTKPTDEKVSNLIRETLEDNSELVATKSESEIEPVLIDTHIHSPQNGEETSLQEAGLNEATHVDGTRRENANAVVLDTKPTDENVSNFIRETLEDNSELVATKSESEIEPVLIGTQINSPQNGQEASLQEAGLKEATHVDGTQRENANAVVLDTKPTDENASNFIRETLEDNSELVATKSESEIESVLIDKQIHSPQNGQEASLQEAGLNEATHSDADVQNQIDPRLKKALAYMRQLPETSSNSETVSVES